MKKIITLLLMLLVVGCSSKNNYDNTTTQSNPEEEVVIEIEEAQNNKSYSYPYSLNDEETEEFVSKFYNFWFYMFDDVEAYSIIMVKDEQYDKYVIVLESTFSKDYQCCFIDGVTMVNDNKWDLIINNDIEFTGIWVGDKERQYYCYHGKLAAATIEKIDEDNINFYVEYLPEYYEFPIGHALTCFTFANSHQNSKNVERWIYGY